MQSRQSPTMRTLLVLCALFAGGTAMSYEQPDYQVLYTDGDIEFRQYAPYLVAETVIQTSSHRTAGNEGFRRLFRYIAGDNEGRNEIAMTAPVQQAPQTSEKIAMTVPVQQGESADGYRVAFMLPTKYTLATAPQPTDSRVYIREVPARLMAVRQFSGRWRDANFAREESVLREALAAVNLTAVGAMERAAYNGPFTLPFMRRNEVMVAVDGVPAMSVEDDIRLAAQQ